MALLDLLETHRRPVAVASVVLILFFVSSFLQRRWRQYQFAKANGCEPIKGKLPSYDPLFSIDRTIRLIKLAKEHKLLENGVLRFKELGNTHRGKRGLSPIIITIEPQNVKTILSLKFADYSMGDRITTFGPLLGHGIFTSDGEDWVRSRQMVRPNFVKEQVAHLEVFEDLMDDLFALIPTDGSTVDLQDLFFGFTIDSATEFLCGHSVHSLKKRRSQVADNERNFAKAFDYAQDNIGRNMRYGPLMFLNRDPKAVEARRVCREMVDQFVDKAMIAREKYDEEKASDETAERRYMFLYGLARQTGDRTRIRDELMNILLAGRDTTASLLGGLFFLLAKTPEVWAKLQEEIASLQGRAPTYDQLREMKYVKYCLNETLRLLPVVPLNSRTAIKDTILPVGGGADGRSPVFVSKGTIVGYSVYAMHRRQDFYGPDAEEFRPERWAGLRPGWEYLPFNGGPRICVGQQYALTEAAYVTTRLAQRYSILESRDPEPWVEKLALTACSFHGTKVSLRH
ncbi:cytochrome P450 [Aspergillus undulatus]|uniref:cytochrome P450 n=1 Tax=Aspergillus undulatus TaxID=1810928 RepID=UPI003CCDC34E